MIPCLLTYSVYSQWVQGRKLGPTCSFEYKRPSRHKEYKSPRSPKMLSFGAVCLFIQESVGVLSTLWGTGESYKFLQYILMANKVAFISGI